MKAGNKMLAAALTAAIALPGTAMAEDPVNRFIGGVIGPALGIKWNDGHRHQARHWHDDDDDGWRRRGFSRHDDDDDGRRRHGGRSFHRHHDDDDDGPRRGRSRHHDDDD